MTEPWISEENMLQLSINSFITFVESRKRSARSVAEAYGPLLRKFERWLGERGKTLDDFTAVDVETFMSELKPSTANVFLSGIREYARFRVNNCPFEPHTYEFEDRRYHSLQAIRPRRVPRMIKKEALTVEEVARLLDLTSEDEPLHQGLVCLFYFGWRPSEGTEMLRKSKIDWRERYIKIMTAKAQHERLLPFADKITPYLRDWYDFVKSMNHKRAREWLTKHLKAYNRFFDTKVTAKTARKTFETMMRKEGVEQWKISFLLGHTVGIPFVYTDWIELLGDLREVMEEKHYLLGIL